MRKRTKPIKLRPMTEAERRRVIRLAKKIIENFERFDEIDEVGAGTSDWWMQCIAASDEIGWHLDHRYPESKEEDK